MSELILPIYAFFGEKPLQMKGFSYIIGKNMDAEAHLGCRLPHIKEETFHEQGTRFRSSPYPAQAEHYAQQGYRHQGIPRAAGRDLHADGL